MRRSRSRRGRNRNRRQRGRGRGVHDRRGRDGRSRSGFTLRRNFQFLADLDFGRAQAVRGFDGLDGRAVRLRNFRERVAGFNRVRCGRRVATNRGGRRNGTCRSAATSGNRELLPDFQFRRNDAGIRGLQRFERHAVFLGDFGERITFDDDVVRTSGGRDLINRRNHNRRIRHHRRNRDRRIGDFGQRRISAAQISVRHRIQDRRLQFIRRLLAFATLNQHGDEAGDADREHTKYREFETGTTRALLFEQRAFGDERIRVVHNFVRWRLVRGNFIFEFGAAKLSLEKFRNALNLCSYFGSRTTLHRENNYRQKDELVKHSC